MVNKSQHKRKIWLVGGGTGGHSVPLLAVAEVLQKESQASLTFIGERDGREALLARQAGIKFIGIRTGKLRRYISISSILLNLRDVFFFIRAVIFSYRLIQKGKPDVIFSKAGHTALPVALAARFTRIPVVTHESDAVLGVTNRFISRFAKRVLTAFPADIYPPAYATKITHVGLPLRSDFFGKRPHKKESALPMILVFGGSQGAAAINQALEPLLPELLPSMRIMHITGDKSYKVYEQVRASLPRSLQDNYGVMPFATNIADYMAEATVIITRASSSIFEIATLGRPMVLIPLPTAANDHQRKNAEYFVRYHAAVMLIQDNLTPNLLCETIRALLASPKQRQLLQEGTRFFDCRDSAKRVAEILMSPDYQE